MATELLARVDAGTPVASMSSTWPPTMPDDPAAAATSRHASARRAANDAGSG